MVADSRHREKAFKIEKKLSESRKNFQNREKTFRIEKKFWNQEKDFRVKKEKIYEKNSNREK